MDDNKYFNYMKVKVTGKELTLIIDHFATYFKEYKLSGNSRTLDSSITISGYITDFSLSMLRAEAERFATVNVYVEEIITW